MHSAIAKCPWCAYTLEGLREHALCPECGGQTDDAALSRANARRRVSTIKGYVWLFGITAIALYGSWPRRGRFTSESFTPLALAIAASCLSGYFSTLYFRPSRIHKSPTSTYWRGPVAGVFAMGTIVSCIFALNSIERLITGMLYPYAAATASAATTLVIAILALTCSVVGIWWLFGNCRGPIEPANAN